MQAGSCCGQQLNNDLLATPGSVDPGWVLGLIAKPASKKQDGNSYASAILLNSRAGPFIIRYGGAAWQNIYALKCTVIQLSLRLLSPAVMTPGLLERSCGISRTGFLK